MLPYLLASDWKGAVAELGGAKFVVNEGAMEQEFCKDMVGSDC